MSVQETQNKRSFWLAVMVLTAAILAVLWWWFSDEKKDVIVSSDESAIEAPLQTPPPSPAPKELLKKAVITSATEDEFNPYESEALKASLQQVADLYEETSKYPINSQPVYNPEDARDHKPFEQTEVDLPFPDRDGDELPLRLIAATERFQYFQGDTINIQVQIVGAPPSTYNETNAVIAGANGDVPIDIVFQPTDQSLTSFIASVDTSLAPTNMMTQEMLVKLNVKVGDRDLFTTVSFRYAIASAQVVGVQSVRPQGPELVIPLQLNVFQNGYYFISAVLEAAATGQPLIQLQSEARLSQGNGIMTLKAHISALRRQGSEGPYVLRSIRTFRGAEVGETFDAPASSSQARFDIPGFPFSAYEDQEYVDQLANERLEFLRGLGSVDEEAVFEREQQRQEEQTEE